MQQQRNARAARFRKRIGVRFGPVLPVASTGFTVNVSQSGILLTTNSLHPRGQHLYVELQLPTGPVRLGGVVAWARRGLGTMSQGTMGLQVVTAREEFQALVTNLARLSTSAV